MSISSLTLTDYEDDERSLMAAVIAILSVLTTLPVMTTLRRPVMTVGTFIQFVMWQRINSTEHHQCAAWHVGIAQKIICAITYRHSQLTYCVHFNIEINAFEEKFPIESAATDFRRVCATVRVCVIWRCQPSSGL